MGKPQEIDLWERSLELEIGVYVSKRRVRVGVAHQFERFREDVRFSTGIVIEVLLTQVHVEVEIPARGASTSSSQLETVETRMTRGFSTSRSGTAASAGLSCAWHGWLQASAKAEVRVRMKAQGGQSAEAHAAQGAYFHMLWSLVICSSKPLPASPS